MLKLKPLNFERKSPRHYSCNITKDISFEIESSRNGWYYVHLQGDNGAGCIQPFQPQESFVLAKRECRKFLREIFKNMFEVEK
jgi:hypothetical protein